MRYKISVFLLLAAVLMGFSQPDPEEELTIIVELKEMDVSTFKKQVEARLPRLEVVAEYDTIFNGVAVKGLPGELDKMIRVHKGIQPYPVQMYKAQAEPLAYKSGITLTTDFIRPDTEFTGRGVKVGVIDTGMDYNHPDLKVNYQGGFDVVDFDDDPMETMEEGATIHGTHVAGVIGADGDMKGVAPDAELYAYRALGPGGMGSSVQVIAAIEEAVEDGMDVINLSLGNDVNGPDWPTTKAVDKAIELGTTVVVAAGNAGPNPWTVGSPATSPSAITVGAAALPSEKPLLKIPGERREIPVLLLQGSRPWTFTKKMPLFNGSNEDFFGVTGKIVLMRRGGTSFAEK
ncbi:S8 family peptidase, partial [Halobacillus massiliensis]|uniref:S8 family peptidase n=1 Tax=Halobacillus massiliensis TaxID=1926286 RepID=UPI0015C48758